MNPDRSIMSATRGSSKFILFITFAWKESKSASQWTGGGIQFRQRDVEIMALRTTLASIRGAVDGHVLTL